MIVDPRCAAPSTRCFPLRDRRGARHVCFHSFTKNYRVGYVFVPRLVLELLLFLRRLLGSLIDRSPLLMDRLK